MEKTENPVKRISASRLVQVRSLIRRHPRRTVFLKNLTVLTITSLVMRGVGVAFSSYLTGVIGADGMGLYSLITSVYAFAVTFASAGINLSVTRLIAQQLGKAHPGGAKRILRAAVIYALFFGLLASVSLFILSDPIGRRWLGDARAVPSLRLLSVTLAPIALGAVFSGYFTAVRRVEKNAVVSAAEQCTKILLTVFLLSRLSHRGLGYACLAMVGGSCIAEGASLMLYALFCLRDCRRHLTGNEGEVRAPLKSVSAIALPVAVTSWARTGLVTLEHILIPKGLQKFGASSSAALAAYGTINGMVFPVIFFPTAFLGTFAGLIIPELSEYQAGGKQEAIRRLCSKVLGLTLLFSIGCAGILMLLAHPLGTGLYGSAEACRYIRIFAALIPMMYLDTVTDSILKGLGAQVTVMFINLLDATICVLAVFWMVPVWGVDAYVWIVFGSEILNLALSIAKLSTLTPVRFEAYRWFLAPLVAVVGATDAASLLFGLLPHPSAIPVLSLTLQILLTAVIYLLFYIALCLSLPKQRRKAGRAAQEQK